MRSLLFTLALLISPALHAQDFVEGIPDPAPHVHLSHVRPDYETNPAADPARPTVTNPAHIPPPGYLQFEQGFLQAGASSGLNDQFSIVQTTKLSLNHRVLVQVASQPYARSYTTGQPTSNDTGDLILGTQFLFNDEEEGRSSKPTVAIGYNHRIRSGTAANLDTGGYSNGALLLISGSLAGLHYDTNYLFNEQPDSVPSLHGPSPARRAQYGQTLSVTRQLTKPLALTGEIWHFTQPLVSTSRAGFPSSHSNAVGILATLGYAYRPNIVFDCGADRGITPTSTVWEGFAGITYLLPHRAIKPIRR